MNKTYEIRRCAECGAMIEVLKDCTCSGCCGFSCCGKPMELLKENTSDGAAEKPGYHHQADPPGNALRRRPDQPLPGGAAPEGRHPCGNHRAQDPTEEICAELAVHSWRPEFL